MKVLICKGKRYTSQAPSGRETSVRGLQGKVERRALCIPEQQKLPTHLRSFVAASRASSLGLSSGRESPTAAAGPGVTSKTINTELGLNRIQASVLPTAAYQTPGAETARGQPGTGRFKPINQNPKRFSNVLPVDAVFMPVNRVNFLIESDEGFSCPPAGKQPLDLIVLEVWTDGSVHPRQAVYRAANALIELISPLQRPKPLKTLMIPAKTVCYPWAVLWRTLLSSDRATFLVKRRVKGRSRRETKHLIWGKKPAPRCGDRELPVSNTYRKTLSLDIGNLDLHVLPYTVLKRNKIETVNDLLGYSSQDLLELQGFNRKHLVELRKSLQTLGLRG